MNSAFLISAFSIHLILSNSKPSSCVKWYYRNSNSDTFWGAMFECFLKHWAFDPIFQPKIPSDQTNSFLILSLVYTIYLTYQNIESIEKYM